jgi:Polyketide cyclase / dehydrase and lipid transport
VRFIKLAFISFIILFIIVTAISLMIPSHVRISKAIRINAPKEKVMEQLSDPVKWKNWYPGTDSLDFLYINGEIKGFIANRQSMQGLMITGKNDSAVTAASVGATSKKISMGWNILRENNPGAVTVQWYMDFKLRWYPWEKFASLLFEKQYGIQMEQGLSKLKTMLEH